MGRITGRMQRIYGFLGSVEILFFYQRPLLGVTASDAAAPAAWASPTIGIAPQKNSENSSEKGVKGTLPLCCLPL